MSATDPATLRERMVTYLKAYDMAIIEDNLAWGCCEYLDAILSGDDGWMQYSIMTDDQIAEEYSDRVKDYGFDFEDMYTGRGDVSEKARHWRSVLSGTPKI